MTVLLIPYTSHCIQVDGYNVSIICHPYHENKYLATVRNVEELSYSTYPSIKNRTYLMELDENFIVRSKVEMRECLATPRTIYQSYTTGLEDCRLINKQYLIGGLLDSNDDWNPEMCLVQYDWANGDIQRMIPLQNEEKTPQKNWLVLNESASNVYILHSYDPLKVISVDKETGNVHTIHYQKVFSLEGCEMHGGGCVYISSIKKFLVCVRVVNTHIYQYSVWLLLTEKYKIVGTSEPFHFLYRPDNSIRHYEMCMSIIEKNERLILSVSLNDTETHILQYRLKDILELVSNKTTIEG